MNTSRHFFPRSLSLRQFPLCLGMVLGALALAGCAGPDMGRVLADTNAQTLAFTAGRLELRRTGQQSQARTELSRQLLASPVGMDAAVQLALANSASLQALLAQSEADLAGADQAGRIANPVFSFERMRFKDELELGRLLSFGLLDVLTLPRRQAVARNQGAQLQVQLGAAVVERVSQVRQAWVRAVAARQTAQYAEQVNRAAEAGAELARRMQQTGNFSRLQRARQHAFHADAVAQLASARHAATAAREELIRLLGLDDAQAAALQLPDRLPDLPSRPMQPEQLGALASQQRLDVRLARLQLEGASQAQDLNLIGSLIDVEFGVRHDTAFDTHTGDRANRNGYELGLRLPLFDWGDAQRGRMNAQSLAAVYRYEAVVRSAASQLREAYSAYRTAHDLALHYRDEIVPLRRAMADENLLRYNGMLIGVFELLADTREQIASVMAAIAAQQQFWLADAALASSLIGKPVGLAATPAAGAAARNTEGAGH